MKTILYGIKPISKDLQFTEIDLVEWSGNMDLMPGDRVLVSESTLYRNDIDTPWRSLLRPGTVMARYGILAYTYDKENAERYGEGIMGPYPDYVDIEMDEVRPTGDKKNGSFTYGVIKIQSMAKAA
jgi:hypothetical protein